MERTLQQIIEEIKTPNIIYAPTELIKYHEGVPVIRVRGQESRFDIRGNRYSEVTIP